MSKATGPGLEVFEDLGSGGRGEMGGVSWIVGFALGDHGVEVPSQFVSCGDDASGFAQRCVYSCAGVLRAARCAVSPARPANWRGGEPDQRRRP